MEFRILGPLEVRDRGRPVELRGRKPRALLAALLLHPGEALAIDALIDALWGERPPPTARAALQNYVAQLRRALGPGLVVSRGGGYALEVVQEQIDLGRFERLTAEARASEGEATVESLRKALSLWRGAPLADIVFEPFAAREADRLEELRTAAHEDLIDAELSLGAGPGLVAELEGLVAAHPFRERLRGQLMLALYRSGRQADALEAYQDARRTLVEELGIEPSASLRELEQAILRQDACLASAGRPQASGVRQERREARRQLVTLLLAEIACPDNTDPELVHDSTVQALSRVVAVLEQHGAWIGQRAGDEVLAVFGIPRVYEDDALRATRAALELQVELARLSDALEAERRSRIDLRLGIETGEALVGVAETDSGFAAGPLIASAKRALAHARAGDVVAGRGTLRMLGEAAVVAAGEGRGRASRVLELREGPSLRARHLEAPLIDREPELAALSEAFAGVVEEGRCRLFLVVGEPGLGKTRLTRELLDRLEGTAAIFVGRCVAYGKGATFLPLAEIIRAVHERGALAELLAEDEHAELIVARLAHLAGADEPPVSGGETFWAASRLFESLASERPLVLVFEDLHWAEPTLLDLIDYTAERAAGAILLLGLARPELLEARSGWSEHEAAHLAPLSAAESDALLENLGSPTTPLRAEILDTAGGNPLFLEQLLAHARESSEGRPLPPSLDTLLASRLDRLAPGELAVLQRAAVVGREFSREVVSQLLPEDARPLIAEHLAAAMRKGLVHPGVESSFRFHHVLMRDAAYSTLPLIHRAELHERVARLLQTTPGYADELIGFHLEQACRYLAELGRGNDVDRIAPDAGDRLAAAGLRAAKTGDAHAASNLLTRAIDLLVPVEVVRRDLLTELGLVQWRAGDLRGVEDSLRAALAAAVSAGDRRAALRARVELAYLNLFRAPEGGIDDVRTQAAEAIPVLERAGDNRGLGAVWDILAHIEGGFRCRYRESAAAAERALEYFARAQWPLTACLQELTVGLYFGPEPVEDAISHCRDLLNHADRGGEAHVFLFQAGLEAMAGRLDAARRLASRSRATYDELGWVDKIWENYAPIAAEIELSAVQYPKAERLLEQSCRRLESWGEKTRLATQGARLGEALYRQGKLEEAARWANVAEAAAASYDVSAQFSWRALRAKGLARDGVFDDAETLAREAIEIASATDALTQRAHVLLDAAEVAALAGRPQAALSAAQEALDLLEEKRNVAGLEQARSFVAKLGNR
jgi:DNA-binding SARP family transcriptional activator